MTKERGTVRLRAVAEPRRFSLSWVGRRPMTPLPKNTTVRHSLFRDLFPFLCHPERSRGICSPADLSWKCFSTERSVAERRDLRVTLHVLAVRGVAHAGKHAPHVGEAADDARHWIVTVNLVFQIDEA